MSSSGPSLGFRVNAAVHHGPAVAVQQVDALHALLQPPRRIEVQVLGFRVWGKGECRLMRFMPSCSHRDISKSRLIRG